MNRHGNLGAIAQTVKLCKGCKVEKPLGDFSPDKSGKCGRAARCRVCRNKQQREARAEAVAPTQADLHRLFHYDGGHLWWKVKPANCVNMSKPAGAIASDGYCRIGVSGKRYLAHRLIFLYVHGRWPNEVDHLNHDPTDNRIENLREVSHRDNMLNLSIRKDNSSGAVGVFWDKRGNRWYAQIRVGGKQIHLGYFASLEEAAQVRKEAERKFGFHPNHGS